MEHKKMVEKDYTDPETGLRFIEDIRGNIHLVHMMENMGNSGAGDITINIPEIKIPEIPAAQVNVNITPPVDDPEKQRLIRIMEALRSENNWLWAEIMKAIINRKRQGAPTAMDILENAIKDRQRA